MLKQKRTSQNDEILQADGSKSYTSRPSWPVSGCQCSNSVRRFAFCPRTDDDIPRFVDHEEKQPVGPRKRILLNLWVLRNQESIRSIADRFDVCRAAAYQLNGRKNGNARKRKYSVPSISVSDQLSFVLTHPCQHIRTSITFTTIGKRSLTHFAVTVIPFGPVRTTKILKICRSVTWFILSKNYIWETRDFCTF